MCGGVSESKHEKLPPAAGWHWQSLLGALTRKRETSLPAGNPCLVLHRAKASSVGDGSGDQVCKPKV